MAEGARCGCTFPLLYLTPPLLLHFLLLTAGICYSLILELVNYVEIGAAEEQGKKPRHWVLEKPRQHQVRTSWWARGVGAAGTQSTGGVPALA